MADFFVGGRVIDVILALVAVEAVALSVWRASTGRGPPPLSFLANLLSGGFLLSRPARGAARRIGLMGSRLPPRALLSHCADLSCARMRRGAGAASAPASRHEGDDFAARRPDSPGAPAQAPRRTPRSSPRRQDERRGFAGERSSSAAGQPTTGKATAIAQASPMALPRAAARGSPVREYIQPLIRP